MSQNEDLDLVTGVHKCSDPIQKLRVRVHLRHVKAAHIPLPQFINEEKERDDGVSSASATFSLSASGTSEARGNSNDGEVRTFAWQEKVFSPFELELYSDLSNCNTALQEQYHREVVPIRSQRSQQERLFSYVHTDNTAAVEETEAIATIGGQSVQTYLSQAINRLQDKKHSTTRKSFRRNWKPRHVQVIEGSGNAESHLMQGFPQAVSQKMYIMADLSATNVIGTSEYVLCVIRWDVSSGTLIMSPDINGAPNQSKPYRIEVDGDARNVYEYWLENVSGDISEEDLLKETEVRSKMYSHQADLRHMRVGSDFTTAKLGTLSTHVFGQINVLSNFEDFNLFVHYFIELPNGWSCEDPARLSGISSLSRASKGHVHLGHPIELNLQLSLSQLEESPDIVPKWPQLMVEVLSLDWWGRYRTEGYGYVTLPSSTGLHSLTIHTWRPVSRSPISEMRRFFIGGNSELDDVTFVGIPQQHEGRVLGKYGVQTIPSGDVEITLQIVFQSSVTSTQSKAPYNALLERLSAATLVSSVNQVLAAFRRAHERMLAAKQGIDLSSEQAVAL